MQPKKIVIIGAGPIGIEAALYGRALGHEVVVFERGTIAANVLQWGFVKMFTSWRMNTSPLGLKIVSKADEWSGALAETCPTGMEFYRRYLLPLAGSPWLRGIIREKISVLAIGREEDSATGKASRRRPGPSFRILNRSDTGREGVELAHIVLDCSGTYGRHSWSGCGGIPAPGEKDQAERICYTIPDVAGRDKSRFMDRHTLLVGSGFHAAMTIYGFQQLCRIHPKTTLCWLTPSHGDQFSDDPLEGRRRIVDQSLRMASKPPAWLQVLGRGAIETILGGNQLQVQIRCGGDSLPLKVDELISLVGFAPDMSLYDQWSIPHCYSTTGPAEVPLVQSLQEPGEYSQPLPSPVEGTIQNPHVNIYILGAKSYGTNPLFSLQIGLHQIRDVYRRIDGPPLRDLYASGYAPEEP